MKMTTEERDQVGRLTCRVEMANDQGGDGQFKREVKELIAVTRVLLALNEVGELVIPWLREQEENGDEG